MRFLLHPAKASGRKLSATPKKSSLSPSTTKASATTLSSGNISNHKYDDSQRVTTTFGQQCSPNCGCVVRFEAKYDPNGSNRIQSMTYDAKTVISTVSYSENGGGMELNPVYTTSATNRNGKPMMKECKCKTVHSLARAITERLPTMTLSQAQNQIQFLGVRSSPSFRYSVLKNHELLSKEGKDDSNNRNIEDKIINVKGGHCFDLIEDALIACLNGYMPKPRRIQISNTMNGRIMRDEPIKSHSRFMEQKRDKGNDSSDDPGLDPLRFVNAAKRRTAGLFFKSGSTGNNGIDSGGSSTLSQSSSMPPFHLMNSHDEVSSNTLTQLRMEIKTLQRQQEKEKFDQNYHSGVDDWLSYVDEIDSSGGHE